jgi:hypothetical protein
MATPPPTQLSSARLTLAPLRVQLQDAVDQAHILVAPPLALTHHFGVAAPLCSAAIAMAMAMRYHSA